MSPQRIHPAAKLLPGLLIVAATAWWGLSILGIGQSVRAQSPANAKSAAGRVEGGGDILSLGAFRQVIISVPGDQQQVPIGLRVSVQFSPCVAGQSGPGK